MTLRMEELEKKLFEMSLALEETREELQESRDALLRANVYTHQRLDVLQQLVGELRVALEDEGILPSP